MEPQPTIDDLILTYPPPPVPTINGKANPQYAQWTQGLATLHAAKSIDEIATKLKLAGG